MPDASVTYFFEQLFGFLKQRPVLIIDFFHAYAQAFFPHTIASNLVTLL
jgi:hypothetical protein